MFWDSWREGRGCSRTDLKNFSSWSTRDFRGFWIAPWLKQQISSAAARILQPVSRIKAKMCAAHCLSGGKGGSFLWMVELCTTAFFLYFYVPSDLKPHPIRHPLDI
jgi:hypothetical protein